jgi:hypothetical protein
MYAVLFNKKQIHTDTPALYEEDVHPQKCYFLIIKKNYFL